MTTGPSPSPAPMRRTALLAAAACLLAAAPLWAADKNPDYYSLAGLKAKAFQKFLDDAKDQGFEPIYINGYDVGDRAEFAGVAVKNPDLQAFEARFDLTDEAYRDFFKEMSDKDFRPTVVSGYHTKQGPRFAAVWVQTKSKVKWRAKHDQSEKEYEDTVRAMHDDGYFPSCVTAYQGPDGGVRYTSLFHEPRPGEEIETRHNLTADQYQDQLDKWRSSGFRALRIHAYATPDGLRFVATARRFERDKKLKWQERHDLTGDQYQKAFDELAQEDYRPTCICGYRDGGEVKFAVVWTKEK